MDDTWMQILEVIIWIRPSNVYSPRKITREHMQAAKEQSALRSVDSEVQSSHSAHALAAAGPRWRRTLNAGTYQHEGGRQRRHPKHNKRGRANGLAFHRRPRSSSRREEEGKDRPGGCDRTTGSQNKTGQAQLVLQRRGGDGAGRATSPAALFVSCRTRYQQLFLELSTL